MRAAEDGDATEELASWVRAAREARAAVEAAGWLAPGGWLAIETARGDAVSPGTLRLDTERDTGPARLTLLQG